MMEGLREALEFITELKEGSMKPEVLQIGGKTYCTKRLERYGKPEYAKAIQANTLTSVSSYIVGKKEELRKSMVLHVESPSRVSLYSGLTEDRERETLFIANAVVNEFEFDSWYDQERFLIELQANFEHKHDLEQIMLVAGNIQSGTTANYSDDGISQKTTVKSGIASNADVIVPNPVRLRPYRTFMDVSQPESPYVFRIKDTDKGPMFKLVEADGGLWKLDAMKSIKDFLDLMLAGEDLDEISITVIA